MRDRTLTLHAVCLLLAATLLPVVLAAQNGRRQQTLAEGWYIRQLETDQPDIAALTREAAAPGKSWLPARMPAQVHEVLLANGLISDPHVGKNAATSAWVGEKDWVYACKFSTPPKTAAPVFLRFGGLDTLAAVYLNGSPIGRFDNMYREYAVPIEKSLAPSGQENILLVVFSSPLRFVERVRQTPEEAKILPKHKYLRKSHSDFNSYLGSRPHSAKVGVFGAVALDMPGPSWIEDVWVRAELSAPYQAATLRVVAEFAGAASVARWRLTDPAGQTVAQGDLPARSNPTEFTIAVPNPKLWWPRLQGAQPLYRLEMALGRPAAPLDTRSVSVGIRQVRPVLRDPATGESRFKFEINGRPIFLQGAGWAPVEGITHVWSPARANRLLDYAEQAHMNLLRVWGEGDLPPADFYDECDRRGILVWQDFMFGYGMHPDKPEFLENCRAEIEAMIRKLRNHPSLLLWVGGNENHMGFNFAQGGMPSLGQALFVKVMPEACARLDPTRMFHPSSPYGGPVPNWPLEGDWHDYSTLTFSPFASVPAFASEVGRVSAPSLVSMRRFLTDEEIWPAGFSAAIRKPGQAPWPPAWAYQNATWEKVGPVEQYPDANSPEELIRVLGTAHGEYLQQRVERERRGVPDGGAPGNRRCWGNMVWRLNDTWPLIYFSIIDYYLEPKIPFYYLRRASEPVLVSFERTADKIAVWVVNDSPEAAAGELKVRQMRFDGTVKGELRADVRVAPGESNRCLDLTALGPISLRGEFLEAVFAGREATHLLIGERYLALPKAQLKVSLLGDKIEISSSAFARQVVLVAEGAAFEDNFFDLPPGRTRTLRVTNARTLTVTALNADLVRAGL